MILKRLIWYFVIIVLLLILFLPGFTKLQELKDKNRDLESKIKQLKVENTLLQQELKLVEEDPNYQEKIIREKMGLVRKGEIPVKIYPENKE